jgi:hypothetical protein
MIVFQFFSLAIWSLFTGNWSELRLSISLIFQSISIPFSFLAPSLRFIIEFSVPDLARGHWFLSTGANCSGSAHRLFVAVLYDVFLFLNLSTLLVRGHLRVATQSVVFIFNLVHRCGNLNPKTSPAYLT